MREGHSIPIPRHTFFGRQVIVTYIFSLCASDFSCTTARVLFIPFFPLNVNLKIYFEAKDSGPTFLHSHFILKDTINNVVHV